MNILYFFANYPIGGSLIIHCFFSQHIDFRDILDLWEKIVDNERPSYGIFGEKNAKYLKQIKKDVLKTKIIKYFLKRGTFFWRKQPKKYRYAKVVSLGLRTKLLTSPIYVYMFYIPTMYKKNEEHFCSSIPSIPSVNSALRASS